MSSIYADEGTIAHTLAAMCLTEGKDAAAYVGRILEGEDYPHAMLAPSGAHRWMQCAGSVALEKARPFEPRTFTMEVTDEMADDVQTYVDAIRQYAEGSELLVENHLLIDALGLDRDGKPMGGTGDAIIITPDELQVHDLKFGKGVEVDAEENEQLMLYGLGAIALVELLGEVPDRVRLVIHQPRIDPRPKEWDLSTGDLLAFANDAHKAADKVREVMARVPVRDDFAPGDWCRFCKAQDDCPVLEAIIVDQFDVIADVPREADRLGRLLDWINQYEDIINEWFDAIRSKAEEEIQAGNPPIGADGPHKLVRGKRGARRWRDEKAAEQKLKSFRLRQDEMYSMKLISPTQAEKKLKDQPKRWGKLQELVEQPDGKLHVAPATDKRPAVEAVADQFDVVAE